MNLSTSAHCALLDAMRRAEKSLRDEIEIYQAKAEGHEPYHPARVLVNLLRDRLADLEILKREIEYVRS